MVKKRDVTTRKKTKVVGTKTFVDTATGEMEEMQVIQIEERDANFHKLWLGHIIQSLDLIGNQKIKVLSFILENLNADNMLIMTQRKMADQSGVGYQAVAQTLKALQESNFLVKVQSGTYQVNPDVIFKGGKGQRMSVLLQYYENVGEKNSSHGDDKHDN